MDRPSTVWIEEFLDHNELGLAMDALVDAALASAADPPNEVSNHLRAASAEMKGYKPSTWDRFIARLE
jgi:hypothetical protein